MIRKCVIAGCGREFDARRTAKTCSPEHSLMLARENNRLWCAKNPERARENHRLWYAKNPECERARVREQERLTRIHAEAFRKMENRGTKKYIRGNAKNYQHRREQRRLWRLTILDEAEAYRKILNEAGDQP